VARPEYKCTSLLAGACSLVDATFMVRPNVLHHPRADKLFRFKTKEQTSRLEEKYRVRLGGKQLVSIRPFTLLPPLVRLLQGQVQLWRPAKASSRQGALGYYSIWQPPAADCQLATADNCSTVVQMREARRKTGPSLPATLPRTVSPAVRAASIWSSRPVSLFNVNWGFTIINKNVPNDLRDLHIIAGPFIRLSLSLSLSGRLVTVKPRSEARSFSPSNWVVTWASTNTASSWPPFPSKERRKDLLAPLGQLLVET